MSYPDPGKYLVIVDGGTVTKRWCIQCIHFEEPDGIGECRIDPPTHDGFPPTKRLLNCGRFHPILALTRPEEFEAKDVVYRDVKS